MGSPRKLKKKMAVRPKERQARSGGHAEEWTRETWAAGTRQGRAALRDTVKTGLLVSGARHPGGRSSREGLADALFGVGYTFVVRRERRARGRGRVSRLMVSPELWPRILVAGLDSGRGRRPFRRVEQRLILSRLILRRRHQQVELEPTDS